jgi:hypothetical protein
MSRAQPQRAILGDHRLADVLPGRRSLMLQAFTGVSKVERRKEIAVKHLHRKIRTTKPTNKSPTNEKSEK